jgi:O-antigen/teichoic acid export membrane protein
MTKQETTLSSRLVSQSLWLLIARVGAQTCAVIVTYLLARRLSMSEFGEYAFIAAAILIGNTLTTFGSDMHLIREIAAKNEFSLLSPALTLQLALSVLFIVFVFILSPLLPNQTSESLSALRIYSLALIPLAFFTVFTSALRGGKKMELYAFLNFTISILQAITIFVLFRRGSGIVTLAYLLLGIQTAGTIAAGILCAANFQGFWRALRFSLRESFSLFMDCIPMAIIAALGIVYQKLSLTMLSLLGSSSMAGLFSASARVIEAARLSHFAVLTALYPAMASANAERDSITTFKRSFATLFALAVVITLTVFVFAQPVMNIFFGLEYQSSIPVLRVLSLAILPYTVNSYLSLRFLAEKREKDLMRVLFVSLIVLLLSNLWLIPRAGVIGASWASLIAETLQTCLLVLEWRTRARYLHERGSHELPNPSR